MKEKVLPYGLVKRHFRVGIVADPRLKSPRFVKKPMGGFVKVSAIFCLVVPSEGDAAGKSNEAKIASEQLKPRRI